MLYPKINTLWARDEKGKIITHQYSKAEFKNIENWIVTEKVDGTNIRVVFERTLPDLPNSSFVYAVSFYGRTDKAQIPSQLLKHLEATFNIEKMIELFGDCKKLILYGEGYGKGIQKKGEKYRTTQGFILFDVLIDGWWLEYESVKDIADKLKIPCVHSFGVMDKDWIIDLIQDKRKSNHAFNETLIEGVVCTAYPMMMFRDNEKLIPIKFKLKVKDYE